MTPRPRQVGAVLRLQEGDQCHHAVLGRHRSVSDPSVPGVE
jgi:hypothetical protein